MYNGTGANTGLQARWTDIATGFFGDDFMVAGRFGGQAYASQGITTTSGGAMRAPFTTNASVSVGFAFKCDNLTNQTPIFWLLDSSGAYQVGLVLNTNGSITAGRFTSSSAFTSLGTSALATISASTWYYITVEVTISDTVGVFRVYVDSNPVITVTGADTRSGLTTVTFVQFGHHTSAGSSGHKWIFDDVYILDVATKLTDDVRIETIRPSADTAQKQLTPDTGTVNFSRVNETLVNGDTSYVFGSSVGHYDLYDLADLSSTPTTVFGVNIVSFPRKTDAGVRSLYNVAKSGVTLSNGPSVNLSSSYGRIDRVVEDNPDTATPWTYASINALQVGPKVN